MKIERTDYGFRFTPLKSDGSEDIEGSWNLKAATVEALAIELPQFFGKEHYYGHAAQKEWCKITDQQLKDLSTKTDILLRMANEAVKNDYKQQDVDDIDTKLGACIMKVERIESDLHEHHMKLSGKFSQLLDMFNENTATVGKLQDELREMPGGYRNSKDIEKLKSRVDELEKKLQPGGAVTVHSKLGDLEESVKLLATELANANKKISELESGCGNARYSVCSKKLDTLEECCKNTVAAGKESERRIDFLESSSRNLSSRLDAHGANIKIMGVEISRFQKFMDKLHDF